MTNQNTADPEDGTKGEDKSSNDVNLEIETIIPETEKPGSEPAERDNIDS